MLKAIYFALLMIFLVDFEALDLFTVRTQNRAEMQILKKQS